MRVQLRNQRVLPSMIGAALLAAAVSMPVHVAASNVIDGCGQSCEDDCVLSTCREAVNGKCVLDADISCDSTESAIILASGNNLDLQGYDITCTETAPAECSYNAVEMNSSGSQVKSDNSGDDEAVISGRFTVGVDCDLNTNSLVEDITVLDSVIAIRDCRTVRNNVIGPSSQFVLGVNQGIGTTGVANGDSINDNYVSGRALPIVAITSNKVNILRNVIHTDIAVQAISLGTVASGADGDAKFNVVFADGFSATSTIFTILGTTDSVNYDGNFCDEDHPDCADCIANDQCEPYTSPFAGN